MPVPLAFARRRDDRVVAGVASGFAATHGVDPFVVRAALVVLTLASGFGVLVYLAGFVLAERFAPARATGASGSLRPEPPPMPALPRRNFAVGLVTAGLLFACRGVRLWPGDAVMAPIVLLSAGAAVLAAVNGDTRPNVLTQGRLMGLLTGPLAALRLVSGVVLALLGLLALGRPTGPLSGVYLGLIGGVLALAGMVLVLGPWLSRIGRQLNAERYERIRSEERAAMAAHLHDSVLQTLALIQRSADDPRRTVTLARHQERQLRSWLYGEPTSADTLGRAMADLVADVEENHDVAVELVVVGDLPLDERVRSLAAALGEALVNAAKHAEVTDVSVYVEVGDDQLNAYVRDRGVGFDPSTVAADRHGLTRSIKERLARVGGHADIDTAPGAGTEVRLSLPLTREDVA